MADKKEFEAGVLIGEKTLVEDYKKLIKENVEECSDDERITNFDKYSSEMRKVISKILFETPVVPKKQILAALKTYRDEALFYNPFDYNDWIKEIKTNLIEKKMFDVWEEIIVKNQLGLLWARDCDFFDDIEDKEPIEFYKINHSSTDSNTKRLKITNESIGAAESKSCTSKSKDEKPMQTEEKDMVISAEHFFTLVKEKVEGIDPDEEYKKDTVFNNLSKQIQNILEEAILKSTESEYNKLGKDIKIYRDEACFYNPYGYNVWIEEIKNVVTKRKMFNFWENVIIKNELGLLWAKDCDFFEDMKDEKSKKFYEINVETSNKDKNVNKIGISTPAQDYKRLIKSKVEEIDPDIEDEKMNIFDELSTQIRTIIESLLFDQEQPKLEKAAEALEAYREEACFYNPYDYNSWIKGIKSKIIEKKMFDFWENFIVKNEFGLLWARDCDFFDDMDDKEPEKFYKIKK